MAFRQRSVKAPEPRGSYAGSSPASLTIPSIPFAEDTCYGKWDPANPAGGHCAVASLVVQDRCGGEIWQCQAQGVTLHFFNVIHGVVVDTTAIQFGPVPPVYWEVRKRSRASLLRSKGLAARYEILKGRML